MLDDNYFSLFQLPIKLPVDTAKLNFHYQELQKRYHPDNFATASDSEKSAIMQKSATINDAYQTLKDPLKAAEYQVNLAGIETNSENTTIHDTEFLMTQFELREQLDDIENANDIAALEQFYDEITAGKKTLYIQLLSLIDQQDWQEAKNHIYKLRYFARLLEQIELLQEKQFEQY